MEINVRYVVGDLREVVIHHDSTQINLGVFESSERTALANVFLNAAEKLLSGIKEGKDNG